MTTNPLNSSTAATAASSKTASTTSSNPNAVLSESAFMQLLLTEMQNQDPTSPMDSTKILTQTSQLATLESADKTNKTLSSLATSLQNSQQFAMISSIGKLATIKGGDAITANGSGSSQNFNLYFPTAVNNGNINITNASGDVVDTIAISKTPAGVSSFLWNGKNQAGVAVPAGTYNVKATYTDANGATQTTQLGTYPISAVNFNGTTTTLQLGNQDVPITNIAAIS